jgi:hypothetical protein
LKLNFPPVGIHDDDWVLRLGPDGLFLQPSLNVAVRTVINLMVATKLFDWDVARCLIMTSVVVVNSVFSEGFSNWHSKHKEDFLQVANNTHEWVKEIIKDYVVDDTAANEALVASRIEDILQAIFVIAFQKEKWRQRKQEHKQRRRCSSSSVFSYCQSIWRCIKCILFLCC